MDRYHIEYSTTTKSLRALKEIISEFIVSEELSDTDILSLRYWMDDHRHLAGNYPFDKIYSLIDNLLSDGVIEVEEKEQLLEILSEEKICDTNSAPAIKLKGHHICLTGNFTFSKRKDIESTIAAYGGFNEGKSLTWRTDYLFVGGCGSDDWAYGNYGNKIKKAKELQEKGCSIQILGEDVLKEYFESHCPPITYTTPECIKIFDKLPEEAQRIIQQEINHNLSSNYENAYRNSSTLDLLISNGIFEERKNDKERLHLLGRNELNERILNLDINISFKKNLSQTDLINWCLSNIPQHIDVLCHDYRVISLCSKFTNTNALLELQKYFEIKFPSEEAW